MHLISQHNRHRLVAVPSACGIWSARLPFAFLAACLAAGVLPSHAQQSGVASSPGSTQARPNAAPETGDTDSRPVASDEEETSSSRAVKVVPPGTPANPPDAAKLKEEHLTWRGEYEADRNGDVLLGPDAYPVPVLYNRKGKRLKSKVKAPRIHAIMVKDGTLTVDGWAGKARLNYDIRDTKYLYFSVPSLGTVVVSQSAFPGAAMQKAAFIGNTLTVDAAGHSIQLTSDGLLLGKHPQAAYVKVDPSYTFRSGWPVMGFGSATGAPYEWPAARIQKPEVADAPPLPAPMRPRVVAQPCSGGSKTPCPVPASDKPDKQSGPHPAV